MFTCEQTYEPIEGGVPVAAATPRMSDDRPALSEQTGWMLRVRDARDKAAFARLFDHYAPRLKAMGMRAGLGAAQAEEVVQDVMLKLWDRAAQFDPDRAQVSAWIYQIARNQMADLRRKEFRPVPEALLTPEEPEPDAAQAVALEQETTRLRKALSALSDEQRQLVEMAYLGELSHAQIKEGTGLPLGTIKSRIRLGLDRLRHELKGTRP